MKSILLKASVPSAVALLVSGLMFPFPAYAAPRDVGNLRVDCGIGDLERHTIVYLEIGDTFTIQNTDGNEGCLIGDPNGILTGEDASIGGLAPGVLSGDDDPDFTSNAITINGSGTFTITEDAGVGAGATTVTFRVTTGMLFANPNGPVGEFSIVGNTFLYEEVFVFGGTTVDATVTIDRTENLVNNQFELDSGTRDATGGLGSYLEPADISMEGFAEYTIAFHEAGDPTAPISRSFSVTVKDIDSEQYVSADNVDYYNLSASPATQLSARTAGSTLFIEELDGDASSNEDEDHWVVLNFENVSSITIRLGSRNGDGASFNAMFADADWSSEPETVSTAPAPAAPAATTTPTLATTGANVEWLMVAGVIALLAGVSFLTVSRRKRTA
jgi:LPXTG-motif cell wall-anchored protein